MTRLRIHVGVLLLLLATVVLANVDPLLAWDDGNTALGHGRLFAYYTAQSNLLAVAAYAVFGVVFILGVRVVSWMEFLRGLATIDMALTGVVNGILLGDPSAPFDYSNFVLHQAGPALIVLWWVVMPPVQRLPFVMIFGWVAHPIVWTVVTVQYAVESSDHWTPYFFIDPAQVGGWGMVAVYLGFIVAVQALLGVGAVLLSGAAWSRRVWGGFLAAPAKA